MDRWIDREGGKKGMDILDVRKLLSFFLEKKPLCLGGA